MSAAGRICPQCGYERQAKDLAPDYECPRCGIIYHKYRAPEPKPPPEPVQRAAPEVPPGGGSPAGRGKPCAPESMKGQGPEAVLPDAGPALPGEDEAFGFKPASPLRRALAGIYTVSLVILIIVPVKFIWLLTFRFINPPSSMPTGLFWKIPSESW